MTRTALATLARLPVPCYPGNNPRTVCLIWVLVGGPAIVLYLGSWQPAQRCSVWFMRTGQKTVHNRWIDIHLHLKKKKKLDVHTLLMQVSPNILLVICFWQIDLFLSIQTTPLPYLLWYFFFFFIKAVHFVNLYLFIFFWKI